MDETMQPRRRLPHWFAVLKLHPDIHWLPTVAWLRRITPVYKTTIMSVFPNPPVLTAT